MITTITKDLTITCDRCATSRDLSTTDPTHAKYKALEEGWQHCLFTKRNTEQVEMWLCEECGEKIGMWLGKSASGS